MINIFTSIPPKHANGNDYIESCVNSWLYHGKVYSINHPEEMIVLKDRFPEVTFIPTYQTQKAITGKPLVLIDAILNEMRFKHEGKSMFINSDCQLVRDRELLLKQFVPDKFTYLHRWNFDKETDQGSEYLNGIDAFLFTNINVLDSIQQTHYCIGQTYFDLYYPFAIQMASMQICTSKEKIIMHKIHKEQYSAAEWARMGEYTGLLIAKRQYRPAQVTEFLYGFLRKITVKI